MSIYEKFYNWFCGNKTGRLALSEGPMTVFIIHNFYASNRLEVRLFYGDYMAFNFFVTLDGSPQLRAVFDDILDRLNSYVDQQRSLIRRLELFIGDKNKYLIEGLKNDH